jgi:parallel beta-helix repeat protein
MNCNVYGSEDEHGIYISNSSDNAIIKNNTVHNNYAAGIQINADPSMGGDGISSDCTIDSNILYENGKGGGAAINLASVRNSTIQNNMIYNNYAGGIAAWDDAQGNQWGCKKLNILHNTIYFKKNNGRWAISMKNGSTGGYIVNNILIGGENGGFEYNSDCLSEITIDYNIYFRSDSDIFIEDIRSYTLTEWQNKGYDKHSFSSSPTLLFINVPNNNFHLQTNSKAIDKGLGSNLSYDFEGDKRPKGNGYDIGADEK